jgi:hypothetical protein
MALFDNGKNEELLTKGFAEASQPHPNSQTSRPTEHNRQSAVACCLWNPLYKLPLQLDGVLDVL